MAEETRYLRFNPDGTSQYIVVTSLDRDLPAELMKQFGQSVQRTVRNVFANGGVPFSLTVTRNECYVYATLSELVIASHYKLGKDKILRPQFIDKDSDSKDLPLFPARWKVPGNMRLVFASRIKYYKTATPKTVHDAGNWLMAFDDQMRVWKLPLPNLYDDSSLCMGTFAGVANDIQSASRLAFEQLIKSDWNSHLMNGANEHSDAMFKFKPGEKEVECIPFTGDWTKHCPMKVATAVTALITEAIRTEE